MLFNFRILDTAVAFSVAFMAVLAAVVSDFWDPGWLRLKASPQFSRASIVSSFFAVLDAVVGAETLAVFVLAHGEDYVSTEMKLVGFAVVG